MKTNARLLSVAAAAALLLSSCTNYHRTIAESNSRVNFEPDDFTITAPYGGQATVVKVLGIDWQRLFKAKTGGVGNVTGFSIPIIGGLLNSDHSTEYAMYDLLQRHPGYDAVFYPQIKKKGFNFLWIYSKTQCEVKARLGKLNLETNDGDE